MCMCICVCVCYVFNIITTVKAIDANGVAQTLMIEGTRNRRFWRLHRPEEISLMWSPRDIRDLSVHPGASSANRREYAREVRELSNKWLIFFFLANYRLSHSISNDIEVWFPSRCSTLHFVQPASLCSLRRCRISRFRSKDSVHEWLVQLGNAVCRTFCAASQWNRAHGFRTRIKTQCERSLIKISPMRVNQHIYALSVNRKRASRARGKESSWTHRFARKQNSRC